MDICIYLNGYIKRLISKSITKYTLHKKESSSIDEFGEKEACFCLFIYLYRYFFSYLYNLQLSII